MIDHATSHIERIVETEQRCIAVVGEEAAILERYPLTARSLNQRELTVVEEIVPVEPDSHATTHLHDAVCAIMYVRVYQTEVACLNQFQTVSSATVEVTVLHHIVLAASHADHATRAIAALSMADDQIDQLAVIAVHEVEAEAIARIYLDAGVLAALDG